MEDKNDNKKKTEVTSGLEAISLVSQLGLSVAIPIVLMAIAGNWLDEKFGTGSIISIIFILLGIMAGCMSAYKLVMAVLKKK